MELARRRAACHYQERPGPWRLSSARSKATAYDEIGRRMIRVSSGVTELIVLGGGIVPTGTAFGDPGIGKIPALQVANGRVRTARPCFTFPAKNLAAIKLRGERLGSQCEITLLRKRILRTRDRTMVRTYRRSDLNDISSEIESAPGSISQFVKCRAAYAGQDPRRAGVSDGHDGKANAGPRAGAYRRYGLYFEGNVITTIASCERTRTVSERLMKWAFLK